MSRCSGLLISTGDTTLKLHEGKNSKEILKGSIFRHLRSKLNAASFISLKGIGSFTFSFTIMFGTAEGLLGHEWSSFLLNIFMSHLSKYFFGKCISL